MRGRRLWVLAFLAFFLTSAAWATATPYDGVPDELRHIVRAAGAGRGELIPEKATAAQGAGAFQTVGRGLLQGGSECWRFRTAQSAACAGEPGGDPTLVRAHTVAGRYPPLYYAVVGWPLALWPNWGGVLGARLLGAAAAAALLACAAYAAVRWTRHRLLPAAVIVSVTPITLHLAGGVNPSGVEIASGVALFVALATLLFDKEHAPPRAALTLAGVSALTLILVRPFGPLFFLIIVGVLVTPLRRARLRAAVATRERRVWVGVLSAAVAVSAAWILLMGTGQPGLVEPQNLTFSQALRVELYDLVGGYAIQMVGVMSWLDTPLPGLSYVVWFMAAGLLLLAAWAVGGRADRWRLFALAAVAFGLPVVADAVSVRTYGLVSQGRYTLPIAVGLPVVAACTLGARGLLQAQAVSVTRMFAALLVPVHLAALWVTMIRWQAGLPYAPNPPIFAPVKGTWLPPLGPFVPLVLGVFGVALLMFYGWRAAERPAPAPPIPSGQVRL